MQVFTALVHGNLCQTFLVVEILLLRIREFFSDICLHRESSSKCCYLVNQFPEEGNANGSQEQASILVSRRRCVNNDVATWDHFGRVPIALSVCFQ